MLGRLTLHNGCAGQGRRAVLLDACMVLCRRAVAFSLFLCSAHRPLVSARCPCTFHHAVEDYGEQLVGREFVQQAASSRLDSRASERQE